MALMATLSNPGNPDRTTNGLRGENRQTHQTNVGPTPVATATPIADSNKASHKVGEPSARGCTRMAVDVDDLGLVNSPSDPEWPP